MAASIVSLGSVGSATVHILASTTSSCSGICAYAAATIAANSVDAANVYDATELHMGIADTISIRCTIM